MFFFAHTGTKVSPSISIYPWSIQFFYFLGDLKYGRVISCLIRAYSPLNMVLSQSLEFVKSLLFFFKSSASECLVVSINIYLMPVVAKTQD